MENYMPRSPMDVATIERADSASLLPFESYSGTDCGTTSLLYLWVFESFFALHRSISFQPYHSHQQPIRSLFFITVRNLIHTKPLPLLPNMQRILFTLAAAASYASATTTTTEAATGVSSSASASASLIGAVVPVGEKCTFGGTPCALGAQCYATNSMLQTICGNFQSSCTSDQQCAFNTCNGGFCNGLKPSSSSSASPATTSSVCPAPGSTDSQGRYSCNPAHQYPSGQECKLVDGCYFLSSTLSSAASSAPTTLPTAAAGTLPLGATCDPNKTPSQCAGGAQCWTSNSMLIAACGNFNAACKSDAECAFNTCSNGLCSGLKPSGGFNATSTAYSTGGHGATSTPTSTHSTPVFTGAATSSRVSEAGGLFAALLAAAAWIM